MADSHLGFDFPLRPRVEKRRRGEDFFANHQRALRTAIREEVDLVVHGGDLFFRSRVAPSLVARGIAQLLEVAEAGIPVVFVPGNHERSRLPGALLASHPLLRWFERPGTFGLKRGVGGSLRFAEDREAIELAIGGFPCERGDVRSSFPALLEQTALLGQQASCRILAMHQAFEGATVGPQNFTFRRRPDTVAAADLPRSVAAVLTGHIHRHQVLTRDLGGRLLPCPVLYPGSVERTSFAEKDEPKGYLIVEFLSSADGGEVVEWQFRELPTRPMVELTIGLQADVELLERVLKQELAELARDAIVRIRATGKLSEEHSKIFSARNLRGLAGPGQTVEAAAVFRRPRAT